MHGPLSGSLTRALHQWQATAQALRLFVPECSDGEGRCGAVDGR